MVGLGKGDKFMLNIMFGKRLHNTIIGVDSYFNDMYEDEWFDPQDDVITQMVKDIDDSILIGRAVDSPYLGMISITELSGGVKTLIMMYKMEGFVTDLIVLGNNCQDWLLRIAKERDITVCTTGYDMLFDDCNEEVVARCLNNGEIIKGQSQWLYSLNKFMKETEKERQEYFNNIGLLGR